MPRYDIERQDSSLIPFYRIFIYIIKNKSLGFEVFDHGVDEVCRDCSQPQ